MCMLRCVVCDAVWCGHVHSVCNVVWRGCSVVCVLVCGVMCAVCDVVRRVYPCCGVCDVVLCGACDTMSCVLCCVIYVWACCCVWCVMLVGVCEYIVWYVW